MPKLVLSNEFQDLEAGKDQVLLIKKVKVKEDFDKVSLIFEDEYGRSNSQQFILGKSNKYRVNAKNRLAVIARAATKDYKSTTIDLNNLEGKFIMADVVRNPGKDNPDKLYSNFSNYRATDESFTPYVATDDDQDYIIYDDDELEEIEEESSEEITDNDIPDDDELFG